MDATKRSRVVTSASLLIVGLCLATASSAVAKLKADGATEASFTAAGPAGMQIVGRTPDLTVSEDAQHVRVTVALARVSTGIALRDRHMREKYLEVDKFPNAELTVDRSALKLGGDASGDVAASLKIHGQSHAVTIHYVSHREGATFHVSGSVHVNMNDYGIQVPAYLGVKVKPDVDVSVRFDASDSA
jgi:polyisoprenoid-binding protein YceI